ncbi:MAG: DUF4232 domain-containing protein [Saccharothrix sp.]|nr:DUF4232 domain-containing protein [Saccharothrix sp.]
MLKFAGIAVAATALLTAGPAVAHTSTTPTCTSVDLNIAFGRTEGTAGTTYREVVLTNRGIATCVLRGFPGVSFVDASGNRVGTAAVRRGERGALLTLSHGASATSDVGFVNIANFDPAVCRPTSVWGLKVYPPDETRPLYLPMTDQSGCAGDTSPHGNHLTVASVRS